MTQTRKEALIDLRDKVREAEIAPLKFGAASVKTETMMLVFRSREAALAHLEALIAQEPDT